MLARIQGVQGHLGVVAGLGHHVHHLDLVVLQPAAIVGLVGHPVCLCAALRPLFDHTVLVKTDWETLEQRNRQRWVGYDYTEEMIREKLEGNYLPNARLVYERSAEPDWIVRT